MPLAEGTRHAEDPLERGRALYLDLLKNVLLNLIYRDPQIGSDSTESFDLDKRLQGLDWPRDAHTMVGYHRLNNLQQCCEQAVWDKVPGDFVECGVWRGGASILMRGLLAACGEHGRKVVLFNSFRGLPPLIQAISLRMKETRFTRLMLLPCLSRQCERPSRDTAFSTTKSCSSRAGFVTHCKSRPSTGSPCCASTETCTSLPGKLSRHSIPN